MTKSTAVKEVKGATKQSVLKANDKMCIAQFKNM